MNVVLDTNVVISAGLTTHGVSAKAFETIINSDDMRLCYSLDIYAEYEEVIARPYLKISHETQVFLLEAVQCFGELVSPTVNNLSLPDEDDRIFYDTAKEVDAILITGNLKHYPVEDSIMTPAQFLQLYQETIS